MSNQIVLNNVSATATIYDIVAPAGVKNGNVVVLGTQNANKYYASAANAAITDLGMAIVLDVPLSYEVEKTENDYVIATGGIARAYQPYKGFKFSIPVANVTATSALAVDKVVVPKAAALPMECLASAGGTEAIEFVIDELFTKAGVAMVKLRCVKA